METRARILGRGASWLIACLLAAPVQAAEYTLAVQPVLSPERTVEVYTALTDYLSEITGDSFTLSTSKNFFSYWVSMKRGEYDLVFDAGHFTDYRIRHMAYEPLVKLPGAVSYSLAARSDAMILDAEELIGRRVAVMPSPGLGMLRLVEMYPSSFRQPRLLAVESTEDAVGKVRTGAVDAAMVPSALVGNYPDLTIVHYTDAIAAPALSAAPTVPLETRQIIREALLSAGETARGRAFLDAINFSEFEPADKKQYAGLSVLLKDVWGY